MANLVVLRWSFRFVAAFAFDLAVAVALTVVPVMSAVISALEFEFVLAVM